MNNVHDIVADMVAQLPLIKTHIPEDIAPLKEAIRKYYAGQHWNLRGPDGRSGPYDSRLARFNTGESKEHPGPEPLPLEAAIQDILDYALNHKRAVSDGVYIGANMCYKPALSECDDLFNGCLPVFAAIRLDHAAFDHRELVQRILDRAPSAWSLRDIAFFYDECRDAPGLFLVDYCHYLHKKSHTHSLEQIAELAQAYLPEFLVLLGDAHFVERTAQSEKWVERALVYGRFQRTLALGVLKALKSAHPEFKAVYGKRPLDPLAGLKTAFKPLKRQAYIPKISAPGGALGDSKFGGIPLARRDAPWPYCACGSPLSFYFQLNLEELPAGVDAPSKSGFFQFFGCESERCTQEPTRPFSSRYLLQVLDGLDVIAAEPPDASAFPTKVIGGWKKSDDYPHPEEPVFESVGISARDAEKFYEHFGSRYPLTRDKLAGWPAFQQDAAYPRCSVCKRTMTYFFHLESEQNLAVSWGDSGAGHIFFCAHHPDVMTFEWASG